MKEQRYIEEKIPGIQAIMDGYGLVTSDLRASIERFGDAMALHTVLRASNLADRRSFRRRQPAPIVRRCSTSSS